MKTLKNNKLLAWMLALITSVCAFLGVMLTTPLNTALADDTAQQITNETFPDTSTWEEIKADIKITDENNAQTYVSGRIFRVYRVFEGKKYGINLVAGNTLGVESAMIINTETEPITVKNTHGEIVVKEALDYIEFVWYPSEGSYVEMFYLVDSDVGPVFDKDFVFELVEPDETPSETPDETPDVEDEAKWNDKVADWANENFGFALTGSAVVVIIGGAIVYVLFFKKRR